MKSIFAYTDYRSFLKELYQQRKQDERGFSYARFSTLLGLGSPNYSQLILEGKRTLTLANAYYAADGLELNEDERHYFELLVIQDGIEEPRHLRSLKERCRRLQRQKPKSTRKVSRAGDELNRWYIPALLVYFAGKPTRTDSAFAARSLGITEKEVQEGLSLLLEQGWLTVRDEYYDEVPQVLWTDRKGMNRAQRAYLSEQLNQSRAAFDQLYDRGAKFGSHTITMPVADLATVADRFESLIESIVVESDRPENEEVVQVNFQIFNLRSLKNRSTR